MKYLLPSILAILTLINCSCNSYLSTCGELKNSSERKIKSYTTYKRNINDKKSFKITPLTIEKKVNFNKNGLITSEATYDSLGVLDSFTENKYKNESFLYETKTVYQDFDHVYFKTISCDTIRGSNDSITGWIVKEFSNVAEGINNYTLIQYDSNGMEKKFTSIQNEDTIMLNEMSYEFDGNNKLKKVSDINLNPNWEDDYGVNTISDYKYDKNGNLKEITCHPEGGFSKMEYSFDKKNRIMSETMYTTKHRLFDFDYDLYAFDANDTISIPEHVLIENHYDKFSNPILEMSYDNNSILFKAIKRKYKYDKNSNWIQQLVFIKEKEDSKWKLCYQELRTIDYYN